MIINKDTINNDEKELEEIVIEEFMLTTLDNPFNPFIQWEQWFAFDTSKGYNTCSYLARITKSSNELDEIQEARAIDEAIDEIVKLNSLGIYVKVTRKNWQDRSKTTSFPIVEVRNE